MSQKNSFKGIIPVVKSLFMGNQAIDNFIHEPNGNQYFHFETSNYNFSHKGLKHLVYTGYETNPIGYSVINKITLAQKELDLVPYRNGEPINNEVLPFDFNDLFFYLVLTGTAVLWKRNIVGVGKTYEVVNTLFLTETIFKNNKKYTYEKEGMSIPILESDLIFISMPNISKCDSNFGLCPLQASLMPMQALNEMYEADAYLLKNKGADVIISNGSDTPIPGLDSDEMDLEMNRRIAGAKKYGKAVTSTANLKIDTIGRTPKELALWDGYKIKLRDVCNVFGCDASHFNDPESKKFSNLNEAKKSLYSNCVLPLSRMISEDEALLEELGYEIFIDTSSIDVLQQDQEVRAKKNKVNTDAILQLNREVQNGVITRDIAIQILVTEWEYDEQEAGEYIGERIEREINQDTE